MRAAFLLCLLAVRDGVLNANQVSTLGSRCSGFNQARYGEGFAEGFSRRPKPNW